MTPPAPDQTFQTRTACRRYPPPFGACALTAVDRLRKRRFRTSLPRGVRVPGFAADV